jgi:hypothetical protein
MPASSNEGYVETDTSKAMQEALQSAVTRMNNGSNTSEPKGMPTDMMGVLMSIVPKLLQGSESSEELVEKLDALQKGDISSMKEQLQLLRKQCFRMGKAQEQLMKKIEEIQREQGSVARAVLDLAHHMSRITVIDDAPPDDDDYPSEALHIPDVYSRTESRTNGNGHGMRPRGTSVEHGSMNRAGRER